jgi:hypothetical protein
MKTMKNRSQYSLYFFAKKGTFLKKKKTVDTIKKKRMKREYSGKMKSKIKKKIQLFIK